MSRQGRHPATSRLALTAALILGSGLAARHASAHPSVSLVMDSRGNLYFSDLRSVRVLRSDGKIEIVLPDVHTHELWVGPDDSLYGEDVTNIGDDYRHRVWRLDPDGRLTDVIPWRDGFPDEFHDYGFNRDAAGLTYVLRRDVRQIEVRNPDRDLVRTISLTGFEGFLHWLTVRPDGRVDLGVGADLLTVPAGGTEPRVVARNLVEWTDEFDWMHERHAVMGLWTDEAGGTYVSIYSGQVLKRVTPTGDISIVSRSSGGWSPVGGNVAGRRYDPDPGVVEFERGPHPTNRARWVGTGLRAGMMRVGLTAPAFLVLLASAAHVPGPPTGLGQPVAATTGATCWAPSSGLAVDHVVIAVSELGVAVDDFRSLGFIVKPGRLHANGLLNSHVKFSDGTALELMSVERTPTDPTAEAYARFLRGGEGGAYLALEADPVLVEAAAQALGLPSRTERAGPFTWVTVDDSRGRQDGEPSPVFFISYLSRPADPDSLLVHSAGVTGIESVRVDATGDLMALLVLLGATICSRTKEKQATAEIRLGTSNADLVVLVPDSNERRRGAIREVTLAGADRDSNTVLDRSLTHGVVLKVVP